MSVVTFLSDYGLQDDFVGVCHNGLLAPLVARLGGVVEVVEIGGSPLRLQPLSASFHGRDVGRDDLAGSGLRIGSEITINGRAARFARTFADVPAGALVLYEDGYRALSIAVNRGSALKELGLELDAEVRIEPAT